MFLTIAEIIDILIMSLGVGFIFSGFFQRFQKQDDVLDYYQKSSLFDWQSIKVAAIVTAPAIILHEFGHKFVAMSFGLFATFHAAYMWMGLGIILKLLNFGFILFVPAYVSIIGEGTHIQFAMISLAGPAVNLVLWLISKAIISNRLVQQKYIPYIGISARINLFLFIFNMLPIPGFDGFHFFRHLLYIFA